MNHYESAPEAIQNAIAAAQRMNLIAYEVYIKKSQRGRTVVAIAYAANPGELHSLTSAYGKNAYIVGFVSLN